MNVRFPPGQLGPLDDWIEAQPEPKPSRPEAIRSLLEKALAEGATRLPFEAGRFSYANIPPGQFTLSDVDAALDELVKHIVGAKSDLESGIFSYLARRLAERGYLRLDSEKINTQVSS